MNSIIHTVEMFSKTIPPDSTVLDVGCGLRPYERFFTHGQYIGIDVESSGRESTGKRADYIFDGTHIPFETNSLDAIICTEVLEHAVDPEKLLDEMHRVLKPNARLLITVPFIWGLHELPYDFRRYTSEGIKKIITNAGFIIEKQQNLNGGVNAIQTLVLSEINNYQKNVLSAQERKTLKFRLINWLQRKLFLLLVALWSRMYRFERVYIDNMVIAKKEVNNA